MKSTMYRVTNFEPNLDHIVYYIKNCNASRDDIVMKFLQMRENCYAEWEVEPLPSDFHFDHHMAVYNWENL